MSLSFECSVKSSISDQQMAKLAELVKPFNVTLEKDPSQDKINIKANKPSNDKLTIPYGIACLILKVLNRVENNNEELDLGMSNIQDDGVPVVVECLKMFSNFTKLNLMDASFTKKGEMEIKAAFSLETRTIEVTTEKPYDPVGGFSWLSYIWQKVTYWVGTHPFPEYVHPAPDPDVYIIGGAEKNVEASAAA